MKVSDAHITTVINEPIWYFFRYTKCLSWIWNNAGRYEIILIEDQITVRWPQPPPEGILVTITYEFQY